MKKEMTSYAMPASSHIPVPFPRPEAPKAPDLSAVTETAVLPAMPAVKEQPKEEPKKEAPPKQALAPIWRFLPLGIFAGFAIVAAIGALVLTMARR